MPIYDVSVAGALSQANRMYEAMASGVLYEIGTAYDVTAAGGLSLVFPTKPVISSMYPTSGYNTGGYIVTVYGSGFTNATSVALTWYGNVACAVDSDTQLRFTLPATGAVGTGYIYVNNRAGQSNAAAFTVVSPEQAINLAAFVKHSNSAGDPSVAPGSVYCYVNGGGTTNTVAYQQIIRGSWAYITATGYASTLAGNGLFRIGIRSDPWPWSGSTYAESESGGTWYVGGYSSFYLVVWAWGSTGVAGGYLTGAKLHN